MVNEAAASGLTQSVERALSILTCFSDSQPRLRVSDIARLQGLSQSTVSRLLGTMESLGFVERDPLHCTGMGKALLAHLPDDDREAILARLGYPRYTPATASSATELQPMLQRVLERGYATEREELAFGRACVAAAIRDASGQVVAATSISGPLSALDLERREGELANRVIEMADHISHKLGFITIPPAGGAGRQLASTRG